MSRSKKKNPILKDNGTRHRYAKKLSSKRIRAKTRNLLTSDKDLNDLIFPVNKGRELTNQYDVCDWKDILDRTVRSYIGYNGLKYTIKVTPRDILRYYRK